MFDYGLVVGRFQGIHKGHISIIKTALELCNHVVVFIGSSQESGTKLNPFDFIYRMNCIKKCFPGVTPYELIILPLPDIGVGDNALWGDYIIKQYREYTGHLPQLYVSGYEDRRCTWFDNYSDINLLNISKSACPYSGTLVRECLKNDDVAKFYELVPQQLHCEYEKMYREYNESVNGLFTE